MKGVRIFRVDNPHTKPLPFWQWLIADIRARHPDVIFLAEAFTRPAMMYRLAKIGFSQSYTLFHLAQQQARADRLLHRTDHAGAAGISSARTCSSIPRTSIRSFLQTSGRPGFLIRAALAATLSGLWGLYSGFELCEAAALPGREEYLDSEKYQIRQRDWHAPGNIIAEISRLNHIRRSNPALQTHLNLTFYNAFNDQVLYYGKATPDARNFILVAGQPRSASRCRRRSSKCRCGNSGCPTRRRCEVEELMRGTQFDWYGKLQHWRFVPQELPFAIFRIRPGQRSLRRAWTSARDQSATRRRRRSHAHEFTDDPLWYKDAVIYQLHLKSFFDANSDGIGDFPGLIEKLDYIAELGVNTVWLLPFYPSPRRDDGYDISDYRGVHPDYGTLADVAALHRRRRTRAACA